MVQISMGYVSIENWEDVLTVPPTSATLVKGKLDNLMAVAIDPFTIELDTTKKETPKHANSIMKDIVTDYLILEYQDEYDKLDHVSLELFEDEDDNLMFSGLAFFSLAEDIPSKEELNQVTNDKLSDGSLGLFMREYIESISSLASIHNVTVSHQSYDPAAYAVSTTPMMAPNNNPTLATTNIATILACAVAGVFGVLALSLMFVLKERQKQHHFMNRHSVKPKRSITVKRTIKAPQAIPELQQAGEMCEEDEENWSNESLNGLHVIDNVSFTDDDDDTKNVPSLSYSHSIAAFSDTSSYCDNVSDVSVEDEYCATYDRQSSRINAHNFRSIWNFGKNREGKQENIIDTHIP